MENDLLVIETSSITDGYRVLNALPENLRIVTAEPVAAGFLIMARGSAAESTSLAISAVSNEWIKNLDQSLLEAAFSLAPTKLSETLIVVETETVAKLFTVADSFLKRGLKALEIKIRKSGRPGAYGYFTGTRAVSAPVTVDAKMHEGGVKIEVLDSPNRNVRHLFED